MLPKKNDAGYIVKNSKNNGAPRTVTLSDRRDDGDLRRQVINNVDIGSRRLCGAEVSDISFHDVGALGLSSHENSCHSTVMALSPFEYGLFLDYSDRRT
jgi:hypothetical protein